MQNRAASTHALEYRRAGVPASAGQAHVGVPASAGRAHAGVPASAGQAHAGVPASAGQAHAGVPASAGQARAGVPASAGQALPKDADIMTSNTPITALAGSSRYTSARNQPKLIQLLLISVVFGCARSKDPVESVTWPGQVDPTSLEVGFDGQGATAIELIMSRFDAAAKTDNSEAALQVRRLPWASEETKLESRNFDSQTMMVHAVDTSGDYIEAMVIVERIEETWRVTRWYLLAIE